MDDTTKGEGARWPQRGVRFTISVAAELVNVHPQTLRHYERINLIAPKRSEGKIRYYTPEDIERLELITDLIKQREVNLEGVRAILELQGQIDAMRAAHEAEVAELRARYEGEIGRLKGIIRRMNGQEPSPGRETLAAY